MAQHNENQNMDTRDTKIYVGGLPWTTREEGLRGFFEQFGEITHANVVYDRTRGGRSEGYGFVTFRDAESATRACENPNPVIDGRQANCNLAYIGARSNNHQNQHNQNGQQLATYVVSNCNHYPTQFYPPAYQFYPTVSTYPPYWTHFGFGPYYMNQPWL